MLFEIVKDIIIAVIGMVVGGLINFYFYKKQKYDEVLKALITNAFTITSEFRNNIKINESVSKWLNSCGSFKKKYGNKVVRDLSDNLSNLENDFMAMAADDKVDEAVTQAILLRSSYHLNCIQRYEV